MAMFSVGSTGSKWKSRFYHHQITLDNIKYSNSTALSKFYQKLKSKNKNPVITLEQVTKAKSFSGKGNKCNLCLSEKIIILKNINNPNLLKTEDS